MKKGEKINDIFIEKLPETYKKENDLNKVKNRCSQLEKELEKSNEKLYQIMEGIAYVITKVVEIRDPYTTGHQQRVSKLATAIARELRLPDDKVKGIRLASLVHDIGKVNLPTEIVSKPSKLIEVEFNLIKNHPKIAYDILKGVEFPWPIAEIVFQHHERIDGSGYPRGLKGDEILIEAKILGLANVIEAMTSYRSYRPALEIDVSLTEIDNNKDILFDSKVVDACLKLFREKNFNFD